ncbi:hypothetical protein BLA6993_01441 [Burkholderia lata]|uniref:hypothetical protein n=1 Tax=Burkholderia lata (strain ATCC 17760 / DSM 23089 / LMG 22485 / NCIMB 9086 / R18194 / 383) TaxID=482957 RepID=UPI001453E717|nr:hypothetical protein [Burkholderia lata]VWB33229.1 hypothetical protein BLA6993_01441 [Burkholderia lata]
MQSINTLVARVHDSWIARTLILGLSFLVPFIWILSTDLIWAALKNVSRNTSDASINIPTAMPLIASVVGAWFVCAFALGRVVKSTRRVILVCNVVAVIVFVVEFTMTIGTSDWALVSGELVSIYPIRFGLAVLIAFVSSLLASRVFGKEEASRNTMHPVR